MKPATLNLPAIWRGCDWGPVTLKWKDANGEPINLTAWTPKAHSLHINLHASKLPQSGETIGHTKLLLDRSQTIKLKLGVEQWDWIWEQIVNGEVRYRFPPFLSGKIQVMDPVSTVGGDTPPDTLEPGTEPPEFEETPTIELPS